MRKGTIHRPLKPRVVKPKRNFAFADTLRMLTNRIGIFVSLPFDKLSKLSLQEELDEIGRTRASTTKEPA